VEEVVVRVRVRVRVVGEEVEVAESTHP